MMKSAVLFFCRHADSGSVGGSVEKPGIGSCQLSKSQMKVILAVQKGIKRA